MNRPAPLGVPTPRLLGLLVAGAYAALALVGSVHLLLRETWPEAVGHDVGGDAAHPRPEVVWTAVTLAGAGLLLATVAVRGAQGERASRWATATLLGAIAVGAWAIALTADPSPRCSTESYTGTTTCLSDSARAVVDGAAWSLPAAAGAAALLVPARRRAVRS